MTPPRPSRHGRRRGFSLAAGLVVLGAGLIWVSLPDPPPSVPVAATATSPADLSTPKPGRSPGVSSSSSAPLGSRPTKSPAVPGVAPDSTVAVTAAAPVPVAQAHPVFIGITSIGVWAGLVDLGLNADRTLQTPTDFGTAGWFTGGPIPGAPGPAVIAGHVDSTAGPAVFYRLAELRPGDSVEIRRRDGSTVAFTVTTVQQFAKDTFPAADVYRWVDQPALRLITCGGDFDSDSGHYRDDIVVFAELATPGTG